MGDTVIANLSIGNFIIIQQMIFNKAINNVSKIKSLIFKKDALSFNKIAKNKLLKNLIKYFIFNRFKFKFFFQNKSIGKNQIESKEV